MQRPTDEELREDITRTVATMVRAGFCPREDISAAIADICDESDDPEPIYAFAAAELNRLWSEQRAAERVWPGRTDCDRLDQAFAELEGVGIICRQDFTCCMTCGSSEIVGQCRDAAEAGASVRGYAFYHAQDTERAVEGAGVMLAFSALPDTEPDTLAIAREIVAVLRSHGLSPEWNGAITHRINVPMQWQRRRFSVR